MDMEPVQRKVLEKLSFLSSFFFTLDMVSGTVHLSSLFFLSVTTFYGNLVMTKEPRLNIPKKKKELSFSKRWRKK